MTGRDWMRRIWGAGAMALLLALAGCAYTPGHLWGLPGACGSPQLFPVPTRPVFGPGTTPDAAPGPDAGRTHEDPVAPSPLPPMPEAIPAPPPTGSTTAPLPATPQSAGQATQDAPTGPNGPRWVFFPPVPKTVLRQMQPAVELRTDPSAKPATQQSPR
jgi:hypothetical protein